MAEPQDIPQPNQEQEAILQRAPYLRAFISHPIEIGANWLDELQPLAEPLEREIAKKLGNEWWTTTLVPITVMAKEQNVFDDKIGLYDKSNQKRKPEQMLVEVVRSLFLIGYEVGHTNAFKFNYQLFKKLSESALFHYPIPEDQKKSYTEKTFNCVWGIIRAGSFIRLYADQSKSDAGLPPGTSPKTDLFQDFIQGLKSIDQLPPKDTSS